MQIYINHERQERFSMVGSYSQMILVSNSALVFRSPLWAKDRKPGASEAVDMARPLLQQHSTLNSSRAESFCEGVMSLAA